jgi:hypothetical protein
MDGKTSSASWSRYLRETPRERGGGTDLCASRLEQNPHRCRGFQSSHVLSSRPKHDGFMSCAVERPAVCSLRQYCSYEQTAGLSTAAAKSAASGRDDSFRVNSKSKTSTPMGILLRSAGAQPLSSDSSASHSPAPGYAIRHREASPRRGSTYRPDAARQDAHRRR